MKKTISVLVENHFGVLTHVSGLFSARGFNIDSLAVGVTEDPEVSRETILGERRRLRHAEPRKPCGVGDADAGQRSCRQPGTPRPTPTCSDRITAMHSMRTRPNRSTSVRPRAEAAAAAAARKQ